MLSFLPVNEFFLAESVCEKEEKQMLLQKQKVQQMQQLQLANQKRNSALQRKEDVEKLLKEERKKYRRLEEKFSTCCQQMEKKCIGRSLTGVKAEYMCVVCMLWPITLVDKRLQGSVYYSTLSL